MYICVNIPGETRRVVGTTFARGFTGPSKADIHFVRCAVQDSLPCPWAASREAMVGEKEGELVSSLAQLIIQFQSWRSLPVDISVWFGGGIIDLPGPKMPEQLIILEHVLKIFRIFRWILGDLGMRLGQINYGWANYGLEAKTPHKYMNWHLWCML